MKIFPFTRQNRLKLREKFYIFKDLKFCQGAKMIGFSGSGLLNILSKQISGFVREIKSMKVLKALFKKLSNFRALACFESLKIPSKKGVLKENLFIR